MGRVAHSKVTHRGQHQGEVWRLWLPCAGLDLVKARRCSEKTWGPSLIYEYCPTEFTRHAQWQCCPHRHFVKDSHNIIIYTQKRLETKMPTHHTKSFSYYYFNYFRHVVMLQKFAGPLVGPLFVGAPVRPNMPNMPKSASGLVCHDELLLIQVAGGRRWHQSLVSRCRGGSSSLQPTLPPIILSVSNTHRPSCTKLWRFHNWCCCWCQNWCHSASRESAVEWERTRSFEWFPGWHIEERLHPYSAGLSGLLFWTHPSWLGSPNVEPMGVIESGFYRLDAPPPLQ